MKDDEERDGRNRMDEGQRWMSQGRELAGEVERRKGVRMTSISGIIIPHIGLGYIYSYVTTSLTSHN